MRRGFLILGLGLVVAGLAYAGLYFAGTAKSRQMLHSPHPELAWLKQEYHLSDAQFARIAQLHETYIRDCQERCRLIHQQDDQLKQLLAHSATVTPEIQKLLAERAQTRSECDASMLKHFTRISSMMPPNEGQRYLAWVEATCLNMSNLPMSGP